MARRIQFSPKELNRLRSVNWEFHYNNHVDADTLSKMIDAKRVARVIGKNIPNPRMQIDGSILSDMATIKGKMESLSELYFTIYQRELMCAWYWSRAGWDSFVESFQSLPEITEAYYLFYDANIDGAILMPMSSKPKRVVDKSGTSQVLRRTSRAVVPENVLIS